MVKFLLVLPGIYSPLEKKKKMIRKIKIIKYKKKEYYFLETEMLAPEDLLISLMTAPYKI